MSQFVRTQVIKMGGHLFIDRLQFAFTISYHYLFPQLTMGLALLIVILKFIGIRKKSEFYSNAARFWAKILAINFLVGVITGIPMEFQFGTNWARFSKYAGGVIGQTLAMEGLYSFFLESTFLGVFLFAEKKIGLVGHFVSAILVFIGAWLSGFFIVATNAWMQYPVGFDLAPDGSVRLSDFWAVLSNPWLGWQYWHTMLGSVVTASFVMSAVGSYYLLANRLTEFGKLFVKIGVISGLIGSLLMLFPTGDRQAKNVAYYQPAALAGMEALFKTQKGADLVIVGVPNMEKQSLENHIAVPNFLSYLAYDNFSAEVKGLDSFPRDRWPTNIPLLFYSYHIMIIFGVIFIAVMVMSSFLLWRKKLYASRWVLWILMLSFPLPYIANTAGWVTAEMGRQPWLVYGLMRTSAGISPTVPAESGLLSLVGFIAIYTLIEILFLFLVLKTIKLGPGITGKMQNVNLN